MTSIKWQDEYSVGVAELDDQHRLLLRTINEVIEEQRDRCNPEKFSEKFAWLIHYAYTHFATEERYMAKAEFPGLRSHILEHIDFIMKTLGLALRVDDNRTRLELLSYLNNWFSSHVLVLDRKYIPFLIPEKNLE